MFEASDIDLLLLQWHTEDAAISNQRPHPPRTVTKRTRELSLLESWIVRPEIAGVDRPLFLVAPELSFPRSLLPRVAAMVEASPRPTVFIAGLEYMLVEEFDVLVASSDMTGCQEADGGWLDHRQGDRVVNCAAIFTNCRVDGGSVTRHYQAKRHPYSGEQAVLATGRHTLLFSEAARTGREPLDFAVQICSDFVGSTAVEDFRRDMAQLNNRAQLDFLFVLQWNPNQRAWAFAQRLDEFYTPAAGLSCGAPTAVLFVNNAGSSPRRAKELGGSCLMMRVTERFRGPANEPWNVYYERFPAPPHSYQVLVFREDGPSFQYLERLRPLRTVDHAPGQGNEHPVEQGSCARLAESVMTLDFRDYSATCRWLIDEWWLDRKDLADLCRDDDGQPDPVLEKFLLDAHKEQVGRWAGIFETKERFTRGFVQEFAAARAAAMDGCPSEGRLEPMRWDNSFQRAARRLLRAAVLLQFAAEAREKALTPTAEPKCHAELDDEISLSFHWGDNQLDCGYLARQLKREYESTFSNTAFRRHIYVFIGVSGPSSEAQDIFNQEDVNVDVTRADPSLLPFLNAQPAPGEIVDAATRFGVINADVFLNKLMSCREAADIRELAQSALAPALTA